MNITRARGGGRFAVLLAACVCAWTGRLQALTLANDGEARAVIILGEQPSAAAREAASVLQSHIVQISGARLPIALENEVSGEPSPARAWLLVGRSRLADGLGITTAGLGAGGIRLESRENALGLLGTDNGADPHGTMYAAVSFLEDELGVRYLWPGESGKVVPKARTLVVGALHRAFTPPLAQRRIRARRADLTELGRLGVSPEDYKRLEAAAYATESPTPDWFAWHKLGGDLRLSSGHAFGHLWEKHGKDHPDWFALQPDGSRDQSRNPGRARLCVSNAELIEEVAKEKIAELDEHPELDGVSIAPNDGGHTTFCTCPRCEALDAPNGPVVTLADFSGWKKKEYKHVALTDRMVYFWNAIAERVQAARPGKLLVVDAYSAYSAPPVSRKPHPNLVVRFVPMSYLKEADRTAALRSWDGWKAAASRIFYRPNFLLAGRTGAAQVFTRKFAGDFRAMALGGMLGTDFDSCQNHWASLGLDYYVVARLNWNPALNVDAVVDDYCRAGFGPAAGKIREYFSGLESLTDETAAGSLEHLEAFTPGALSRLDAILGEARLLAAGDRGVERRIDFLKAGLRWTRVEARAHSLLSERGKSASAPDRKAILEERRSAMRDILENDFLAVNVAAVSAGEDERWERVLPSWKRIRSRLP